MSAIILFDGVCNFCNASVNFVIARDRAGYFKFAPLQSEIGEDVIERHGIDTTETDSVILVEDNFAYTHSTAALRIARRLDGLWSWLFLLIVIPRPIRDVFYRLFARYRYRLFGRQDACMMPTPDIRDRFLS
ncbi:MAG: thiol-disulfide oxidoreductase DCC family protein [Blastocatellia bacterium]|nr:thiol-disulfide oxidoreductase DCC family protein [Chloracidobacterium sp.]MBL8185889.1 thiol-disulfide oxidoreductase DCC family protein [Blastocatellia bacterium]HRJ89683.1 thiol-disulfide oxidoreductase DCC family protein [Pyrinomonadaceae bacterium]HRK50089.1 thiol-disulfide oxidoreductase DCC family protein [Pyrinomonadaceae bacterium]